MVRAKFKLSSIKQYEYGGKQFEFSAVYDDGIEENKRYAKATPSGSLLITVDNPPAAEFFEIGKSYYLDFSKAE
jgi:hypothetical protein